MVEDYRKGDGDANKQSKQNGGMEVEADGGSCSPQPVIILS